MGGGILLPSVALHMHSQANSSFLHEEGMHGLTLTLTLTLGQLCVRH